MSAASRIQGHILELKPCDFRRKLLRIYLKDIRTYSKSSKAALLVKHVPRVKTKDSVSVLTQHCGSSLNVVRKSIQALDLIEALDETQPADIVWIGINLNTSMPLFDRFVNKFPDSSNLLSKLNLFRSLELQRSLLPDLYGFYPPTWFVPFQNQALQLDCRTKNRTYIIKPSNGGQGKGIYLAQLSNPSNHDFNPGSPDFPSYCKPIQSLLLMSANPNTPHQNLNKLEPATDIVQRYETNPVLLNGYKTDLRIYVLIESLNPLKIHIYRDALVRLASCPYKKPNATNLSTQTMHLTNYSINKLVEPSDKYGRRETDIHSDHRSTNRTTKSYWKRSLHDLLNSPESGRWFRVDQFKFWRQIDEIVRRTMFALCPHFKVAYWARFGCSPSGVVEKDQGQANMFGPRCFQILGFDFLILEPDFRPILLEVNSNPSLRTDSIHLILPKLNRETIPQRSQTLSPRLIQKLPKRLSRALEPSNPVAEAATILSSSLGDRYAEFERSEVDEEIKGGLVRSTLFLMANQVRRRRAKQQLLQQQQQQQQQHQQQQQQQGQQHPHHPQPNPQPQRPRSKSAAVTRKLDPVQKLAIKRTSSELQLPELLMAYRSGRLGKSIKRKRSLGSRYSGGLSLTTHKHLSDRLRYSTSDGSIKLVIPKRQISERWDSVKMQVNMNSKSGFLATVPEVNQFSRTKGVSTLPPRFTMQNPMHSNPTAHSNKLPQIYQAKKHGDKPDLTPRSRTKLDTEHPSEPQPNLTMISDQPDDNQRLTDSSLATDYSSDKNLYLGSLLECIYDETIPQTTKTLASDQPEEVHWNANFRQVRDELLNLYTSKPNHPVKLDSLLGLDSPMRIMDLLADLFINVLALKRRRFEADRCPSNHPPSSAGVNHPHPNQHRPNEPEDPNSNAGACQQFVARMDLSNFRSFCRLCHIDCLGISFTELDLIYSKHRNWWNRVFEVETSKVDLVKGISFPAFVDLCVQLANYLCNSHANHRRKLSNQIPIIPLSPCPMKSAYKISPSQSGCANKSSLSSLDESKTNEQSNQSDSVNCFYRFIQHCCTNILQVG